MLIFLETSADPNVGGALLEIFAYISCNNLIYTVPVNEVFELNNFVFNRLHI